MTCWVLKRLAPATSVVRLYWVMFLADLSCSVGNLSCFSGLDSWKNGFYSERISHFVPVFIFLSGKATQDAIHPGTQ